MTDSDPFPSWNEGSTKQSILDFVRTVTAPGGLQFVKPEERIAVFDNDGTLWSEQPFYFQFAFVLDRMKAIQHALQFGVGDHSLEPVIPASPRVRAMRGPRINSAKRSASRDPFPNVSVGPGSRGSPLARDDTSNSIATARVRGRCGRLRFRRLFSRTVRPHGRRVPHFQAYKPACRSDRSCPRRRRRR